MARICSCGVLFTGVHSGLSTYWLLPTMYDSSSDSQQAETITQVDLEKRIAAAEQNQINSIRGAAFSKKSARLDPQLRKEQAVWFRHQHSSEDDHVAQPQIHRRDSLHSLLSK